MGGASGTFPVQRGRCNNISVITAVSNPFTLLSMVLCCINQNSCDFSFKMTFGKVCFISFKFCNTDVLLLSNGKNLV